jgi:hypothetical protein
MNHMMMCWFDRKCFCSGDRASLASTAAAARQTWWSLEQSLNGSSNGPLYCGKMYIQFVLCWFAKYIDSQRSFECHEKFIWQSNCGATGSINRIRHEIDENQPSPTRKKNNNTRNETKQNKNYADELPTVATSTLDVVTSLLMGFELSVLLTILG